MLQTFRAIIFDLDGVIADSHPVHEIAWRALLTELGHNIPNAEITAVIRQGKTRNEILKLLLPGINSRDGVAIGNRKNELYVANMKSLRPVSGVLEWISQLSERGVPLAVATSASRPRAVDTLAQFGAAQYFKAVITSSEIPAGKPDPGLFLAAAEALAVKPAEALVVEDSIFGLIAAKAAGMQTLFYCPGGCDAGITALKPDYIVDEFSAVGLTPVMQTLNGSAAIGVQS